MRLCTTVWQNKKNKNKEGKNTEAAEMSID